MVINKNKIKTILQNILYFSIIGFLLVLFLSSLYNNASTPPKDNICAEFIISKIGHTVSMNNNKFVTKLWDVNNQEVQVIYHAEDPIIFNEGDKIKGKVTKYLHKGKVHIYVLLLLEEKEDLSKQCNNIK